MNCLSDKCDRCNQEAISEILTEGRVIPVCRDCVEAVWAIETSRNEEWEFA